MAGNITTSTGKAFVVGTMSTEALTARLGYLRTAGLG